MRSHPTTGGVTSTMLCPRRERKQNQVKRRYAQPAPHNDIINHIDLQRSRQNSAVTTKRVEDSNTAITDYCFRFFLGVVRAFSFPLAAGLFALAGLLCFFAA